VGLGGRRAYVALARHLAGRLGLPPELWPDGPDAPASAHLEALPLSADVDLFGLSYERFFSDLFKGERGQYFTPRPLVELVVDLAQLRPRDRVLDPTCGSGGFLVAALARGADPDGFEIDPDLVTLARLNLALHGGDPRGLRRADFFAEHPGGVGTQVPLTGTLARDERWDVVLANPPFSVEVSDPAVLARYALAAGRTRMSSDVLFLEAALSCVKPGGRVVTVLPYTLLAGAPYAGVRAWVDSVAEREAIVSLPEGVFRPFGGTPTRACVIALRKRPARVAPTLYAVIENPGFDPRRQTFRRTEPDELVGLRLLLASAATPIPAGGGAVPRAVRRQSPGWIPEEELRSSGIAAGVQTFRVSTCAALVPREAPATESTVIDFADLDKSTGEIVTASVGVGAVSFREGDVLFGRMRPELRNVTLAERPSDDLPEALAGSGEWVILRATEQPSFLLLALRSPFARAQLVTGGQTRPRARPEDIAGLELPDPGVEARAALDAALSEARTERRRLRRRILAIDALYVRFGRGELDAAALIEALATV
jgi:SAM-dependent methyltransferase